MSEPNPRLVDHVAQAYGLTQTTWRPGPRQFVATTWVIERAKGPTLFCKVIAKPRFARRVRRSLPTLHAMRDLDAVAPVVPRVDGALHLEHEAATLYLQHFIDAPQSYDYTLEALARALAHIHEATPDLEVTPHPAPVTCAAADDVIARLDARVSQTPVDDAEATLERVALEQLPDFRRARDVLRDLESRGDATTAHVLTHGDAPGNVLVSDTLHFIDWDDIQLAAPERDLWMLQNRPAFMNAYGVARSGFASSPARLARATLVYFFEAAQSYLDEAESQDLAVDERAPYAAGLEGLQTGWMAPHMKLALG